MTINEQKPQAASHMFWFFILPAAGFMIWASIRLMGGLLQPTPQDIFAKLGQIRAARTPGDRWQAAYVLSQELQKMIRDKEIDRLAGPKKVALYTDLQDLLRVHSTDSRLKRYLLLTLGQMGDPLALPSLEEGLRDQDPEVRFFSAWGFIDILSKHPTTVTQARIQQIESWTQDPDPAFRKISATFLVQQKNAPLDAVDRQLKDPDTEVRWNAAVALASVGRAEAGPVLGEVFDLQRLRSLEIHNGRDLEQLVATAYGAATKLKDPEILKRASDLRNHVNPKTPEGRAILMALTQTNERTQAIKN